MRPHPGDLPAACVSLRTVQPQMAGVPECLQGWTRGAVWRFHYISLPNSTPARTGALPPLPSPGRGLAALHILWEDPAAQALDLRGVFWEVVALSSPSSAALCGPGWGVKGGRMGPDSDCKWPSGRQEAPGCPGGGETRARGRPLLPLFASPDPGAKWPPLKELVRALLGNLGLPQRQRICQCRL